jgi:hypothetical protein
MYCAGRFISSNALQDRFGFPVYFQCANINARVESRHARDNMSSRNIASHAGALNNYSLASAE